MLQFSLRYTPMHASVVYIGWRPTDKIIKNTLALVKLALLFYLLNATSFPLFGLLATHYHSEWLPIFGARQPSGLNN